MKSLIRLVMPAVLLLVFMTQCDVVSTNVAETDSNPNIQLTNPDNDSIGQTVDFNLDWTQITDAQTYKLIISKSENFDSIVVDTTVTNTTFKVENISSNMHFYWKIYPVKVNSSGPWSEVMSFKSGEGNSGATNVMTLVSPVNNADKVSSILRFTWKKLINTEEYVYQLSDNRTFNSILLEANVTGTSFIPERLQYQKRYFWRVKGAGDGNKWSRVWTFTTGTSANDEEIDSVVTLIAPVHNADKVPTNLEFTWQAISGVSSFEYQLSDNQTFSSVLHTATVQGTSYKPAGLVHQKKYHWRVRVAGNGNDWSEVRTFTTGTQSGGGGGGGDTNTPVTLLAPQNNAVNVPKVAEFVWQEQSGVMDYQLQVSENNSFNSIVDEKNVFGTTYSSQVLSYNKKYFWRVKANVSGSVWSAVYNFQTVTEPITGPPPASGSFYTTQNANFMKNGQVVRFAGTNAYYLPNYEKLNPGVVNSALDLFQNTGITVVRMWGFYDGYDCGYSQHDSSENVIQTAPGVYSESALRDLDRVIAKGKERGISFIIPFINYWDELGGVCQYNTWAGASNPSTNMTFFLSNPQTQKWFKDYITMLLNRVNTVTGIAYKDEPAIFAWQIMNEGRNSGKNATILRNWYQEIAQHIKSIDSNHMVSTGEEGFDEGTPSQYSIAEYSNTYVLRANEGTSYIANTSIPEIDFGSAHWYPGEFGFGNTVNANFLKAQRAWLTDHKNIAESVGKPFYLGEFGLAGWGNQAVHDMYNALYQHAESIQLDGSLLWQLVADGTKCWEFGGNICYPGGRADTELYNKFKQHVFKMKNQN